MNWFERFFKINSQDEMSNPIPEKEEVTIGASTIFTTSPIDKNKVPVESQIPAYCNIGNLNYEKKYSEAIELGNNLLKVTPQSAGVHVNLMDSYLKMKDEDPSYLEKSTEHARLAMLYGHNTGYVQKRLAINLEKLGKIYQAMQVCDIVLMNRFHFSRHGCGTKEEFIKRKTTLEKKITKAIDKDNRMIFSKEDISYMLNQIRLDEINEKKERLEFERKRKEFERSFGKF